MNIHKHKTKRTLLLTALIVAGLAAAYLFAVRNNDKAQPAETITDKNTAKKVINKTDNPPTEKNAKIEDVSNTPHDANGSIGLYISSLSQDSEAVYSSAIVEDTTSGNCTFSFKNKSDGTVIEETKPVQLLTNYYACGTFMAKKDTIQPGTWVMTVTLEANGSTATSGSKELEVIK